jgi:DNA-binding NarL/FixJ family response regulator
MPNHLFALPFEEAMRILIVEDSATDRQLLRYLLEDRFQNEAKFREAGNLETAVRYLEGGNIDCVVLDLQLPDSVGRETFEKLIARFPDVPIIVMTHNKDRELALDMIKAGAADYIIKSYTNEEDIFRRIVFAVEKHSRNVRTSADNAATMHKLDRAKANMLTAHSSGEHVAIRNTTIEATTAIADVSKSLFTELQAISNKLTLQNARQESVEKIVEALDRELLKGHSNRPSMRSQVDLIDHRLTANERKTTELSSNMKEAEDNQRMSTVQITQTKMTNQTKALVGVLTFLGVVVTAAFAYEAAKQQKDTPAQPAPKPGP